jgi:hypothetical protein
MNLSHYIQPEWIDKIKGKPFYYPCAGHDWDEPIKIFGEVCTELWFCDHSYEELSKVDRIIKADNDLDLKFITHRIVGNVESKIENNNGYKFIESSKKYEQYEYKNGKKLTIIRRRGFGQIGLHDEFMDNSLSVFMHRGDSQGEGGSNVYFFKNFKSNYEKIGNLANLVTRKINNKALIITDGSNSPKGHPIRKFHRKNDLGGFEAYQNLREKKYTRDGLIWQCVGYLSMKYGPTLAWGVTKV